MAYVPPNQRGPQGMPMQQFQMHQQQPQQAMPAQQPPQQQGAPQQFVQPQPQPQPQAQAQQAQGQQPMVQVGTPQFQQQAPQQPSQQVAAPQQQQQFVPQAQAQQFQQQPQAQPQQQFQQPQQQQAQQFQQPQQAGMRTGFGQQQPGQGGFGGNDHGGHGGGGGGFGHGGHRGGGFGHGGGGYGGHRGGFGGHHGGGGGGFGNGGGGGYGGHHGGGGGGGYGHGGGFGGGHHGGHGQQQQQPYDPYTREDASEEQLFKDHSAGINFDNYESIEVKVQPEDVPAADVFQAMDFNSLLHDNIRRCNYVKPTPVQRHGIPIVLAGKDLMACAQTGSGKTAAYLLPALQHAMKMLSQGPTPSRPSRPSALILAPTRELALQIYDEGRKFTYRTGLRCVVVYGGADSRHQMYELQRGANMIVATPGRLLEMYQRGLVSFSLIQFLVLDEADRMLDMGFEPQIRQIVEGPESDMPRTGERQTLMYSATFPKEIRELARCFLSGHYFLQVGRVGSTTENITQDVRWVEDGDKRDMLLQVLGVHHEHLTLIFVEKKREADYLERFLHQNRIPATSIHGDRTQREREMALMLFKTQQCRVLVATDVAARGLDIPNVGLVVQHDLPTNIDDYVHRIGRTGRAGKTGTAVAFFNDNNINIVDDLVSLLEESKQQVPDYLRPLMKRRPPPGRGRGRGRGRGYGRGGYGRGGFNRGFGGGRGGGGGGFSAPPRQM